MNLTMNLVGNTAYAQSSVRRALQGEISGQVRAVVISLDERALQIRFYIDGEVSEADYKSASCVEAEVSADYDASFDIEAVCMRVDAPSPIDDGGTWVYRRTES